MGEGRRRIDYRGDARLGAGYVRAGTQVGVEQRDRHHQGLLAGDALNYGGGG